MHKVRQAPHRIGGNVDRMVPVPDRNPCLVLPGQRVFAAVVKLAMTML